jgi:hypothetical protein
VPKVLPGRVFATRDKLPVCIMIRASGSIRGSAGAVTFDASVAQCYK